MKILDGKSVARTRAESLTKEFASLPVPAKLAIVQVGDVAESTVYINRKIAFAESIGVEAGLVHLPEDISEDSLIAEIKALNDDQTVHGIILQLPIPQSLDRERVINTIDRRKDVDGLTARNMWRLMDAQPTMVPATAYGIHTLLTSYDIPVEGKNIVIVGDSLLVGKSTALYFLYHDATVTVCHDKTVDLAQHTRHADIVIVAVGKPNLITADHVSEGQIIVDVGINRINNRLVGDVAFDDVAPIVDAITPVPGGVGPLTVVSLFENMLKAMRG